MITAKTKLIAIKLLHTVVWLFFNVVIFYMLYAAVTNRLNLWLWIGYGLFIAEGLVLLIFRSYCPLTLVARNYTDSQQANFDIYLPEWLAKYNKQIYSCILLVIVVITIYQLWR